MGFVVDEVALGQVSLMHFAYSVIAPYSLSSEAATVGQFQAAVPRDSAKRDTKSMISHLQSYALLCGETRHGAKKHGPCQSV
jgi:hypothetical protein